MTDHDPAVETWRTALNGLEVTNSWDTASTSARLRQAEAEVARLRAALHRAHETGGEMLRQRDAALATVDRLSARIDRQRRGYYLTEQGRAALADTSQEQP